MIKTIAALTAVALLAAACSGGEEAVVETTPTTEAATTTSTTSSTTSTTEPTESSTTTTVEPVDDSIRRPLTGEIVGSEDDLLTRPALAVKIDNNVLARPNHSGLAVADIVFEEIVEVGTRFAAVFHTTDSDPIGPIRSGREQDVNLLSSLNAPLLAWSGGNPGVTRLIQDSFLTDLNAQRNGGAYFRGPGPGPHDLYSSTEVLYALTPEDHPGAPPQQFAYVAPGEQFEGRAVTAFDVSLDSNDVRWEWDAATEAFARFQEGSRHVDVVHGDIFATNVVVMVVDYVPSSIDRNAPDAQTLGSGPAYVFSNGQVQVGRWARDLAVGAIRLTDADGEPIALTSGNTWVELAEANDTSFILPSDAPAEPATVPQIVLDDPALAPTSITIEFA